MALAHQVNLLAPGPVELGPVIDWHRDFKSGFVWPSCFYQDVQVTRLDDTSDAKVPWELSRGHSILALARAAVLYDDGRYALEAELQLLSWIEQNPPGRGINWVNAMEVAIRAANWLVAIGTLEGTSYELRGPLRDKLTRALSIHAAHIEHNLEGSPLLLSNHYLADILGLMMVGASVDDPRSKRWFQRAHRAFERQIQRQVHPDGLGFEASLAYHGLALEIFVLARWSAARAGRPLSAAYDQRLAAMLTASASLRHPNGRIPLFDDNDSGRILPATDDRPPSHDHLIWLGAAILHQPPPLPGPPHWEVAWLLGVEAWEHLDAQPTNPPSARDAFPDGGLFVLRGRSNGTHVVVRCGDVGQNGNGGHSHNDQLSYELSFGQSLIVDPGTYLYTADVAARNTYRSVRAHNVVVIDDQEPNPIRHEDVFALRQQCRVEAEEFQSRDGGAKLLVANLQGFAPPLQAVVIRRSFVLAADGLELSVDDWVSGPGSHSLRSSIHLAPGTVASVDGTVAGLRLGSQRYQISFVGSQGLRLLDGCVSDRYGEQVEAPVLVAWRDGPLPASFGYRVRLG